MDAWKEKFNKPKRLQQYGKCIWEEKFDIQSNQVDIWKGCPDFAPSKALIKALTDILANGDPMIHQYTTGCGHPRLTSVLAKLYSTLTLHNINPNNDVLISVGVYGAIYSTVFGNITNQDEVIFIEPFSDFYDSIVRMAGGIPVYVPLHLKPNSRNTSSNNWVLDLVKLESAFNSKTKMIIIDTPNMHLGKVYNKDELWEVSNMCKKWNVLCVAVEADEFLVFDTEKQYTRLAMLPDMRQRTITIGSSESTFFLKGWKIAWTYGPAHIIKNSQISHLNSVFVCTTVLQEALAIVIEEELQLLNKDTSYFTTTVKDLNSKKQIMYNFLSSIGMEPLVPDSGVFMIADWSPLENKIKSKLGHELPEDFDFVKWFVKNSGIQAVPLSMFFSDSHASIAKKMVRFCFNKKHETLLKAEEHCKAFSAGFN